MQTCIFKVSQFLLGYRSRVKCSINMAVQTGFQRHIWNWAEHESKVYPFNRCQHISSSTSNINLLVAQKEKSEDCQSYWDTHHVGFMTVCGRICASSSRGREDIPFLTKMVNQLLTNIANLTDQYGVALEDEKISATFWIFSFYISE